MRVAVLNTSVPFLRGGAEHLADGLLRELAARGHEVEHLKLPLRWATPQDVAESMVAAASIRMPEAERVIALKFPAYLVQHPNKVVWLLHQFRQVYDLWGTPLQDLPDTPETADLRRAIRQADARAFTQSQAIFSNSTVTASRLQRFNGFTSKVILAPHSDPGQFSCEEYGDFVLAIGRVTAGKRQHLLLEALAQTSTAVRLVIAGKSETDAYRHRLEGLIAEHGMASRVQLIPEFISEKVKADLLARCRAVAYLPVDEDSYGYVTAEAMYSSKPVITCADAGGVLELVVDGHTGLVCDATAASLAVAMDRLGSDEELARHLGRQAAHEVDRLDLSWDRAVSDLLA